MAAPLLLGIKFIGAIVSWGFRAAEAAVLMEAMGQTIAGMDENETIAFKKFICEYAEDLEWAIGEIKSSVINAVNNAHWLAFDPTGESAFVPQPARQRDIDLCSDTGDSRACRNVRIAESAIDQYDNEIRIISIRFNIDVRDQVIQALESMTGVEAMPALAIRAIDFNQDLANGDDSANAYWLYDDPSTQRMSREIFVDRLSARMLSFAETDQCPERVKAAISIAIEMFKNDIEASAASIKSDPSWKTSLALASLMGSGTDPEEYSRAMAQSLSDLDMVMDDITMGEPGDAEAAQAQRERERRLSGPRYEWITNEFVVNSTSIEMIGYNSAGTGVCNMLEQWFEYDAAALETSGFWNKADDLGADMYNAFNNAVGTMFGFTYPIPEENSCGRACGLNARSGHDTQIGRALHCGYVDFNGEGCMEFIASAAIRAIESGHYDQAFEMFSISEEEEERRDLGRSFGVSDDNLGHYDDALGHVQRRFAPREPDDGTSLRECFIPSTKISMWDGTYKEIKDIKLGDEVLSMSKDLQPVMGIVTHVLTTLIDEVIPVAKLGELTCSTTHPIFYKGEWSEIKDSSAPVEIVDEYVEEYWNLEIDAHDIHGSDHNFIADGYLMSGLGNNITLNTEYQRQPKWNDENREEFLIRRLKLGPLQSSEDILAI